jgi:death-on-curing protein
LIVYLSVAQIKDLHRLQIRHYGGAAGLRDSSALEAAAGRPAMTYGGEDLYPDVPAKAAALLHSIVVRHPFVDGNKRTGAHAALVFIKINGWRIQITDEELEGMAMGVASAAMDIEALTIWFRQRTFFD